MVLTFLLNRKTPVKTILRENLISALREAIMSRSNWEREQYGENYESCLVAGWKEILEFLSNGEYVEVITRGRP